MAITGNPGDLATGGFGTGISGRAATPGNVASAVSRGNAMAAGRMAGGPGPTGGLLGNAMRAGGFAGATPASLINAGLMAGRSINPMGAIYAGGGTGTGFTGVTNSLAMQELQAGITADALRQALLAQTSSSVPSPSLGFLDKLALSVGVNKDAAQGLLDTLATPKTTELIQGTMTEAPTAPLTPPLDAATRFVSPSLATQLKQINTQPAQSTMGAPTDYGWMATDTGLPIGMQNFNPGNLKYTGSTWQQKNLPGIIGPSKYTDQGTPQIQFSDPVSGMAAAATLALAKQTQGMDTVESIIAGPKGWTPGYTPAANNIAKTMGISPTANIDLTDPSTMNSFLNALVKQEQGASSSKYGPDVYSEGITRAYAARGITGAPSTVASVASSPAVVSRVPAQIATQSSYPSRPTPSQQAFTAMPSPTPTQVVTDQAPFAYPPRPVTPTPTRLEQIASQIFGNTLYDDGTTLLPPDRTDADRMELAMSLLEAGARKPARKPIVPQPEVQQTLPPWWTNWYNQYGSTGGILG